MKDGKAEVLDVKVEPDGNLRVRCAGKEDRDRYIAVTRALCAPGTRFELVSDTEVLCKLPRRSV